ncbi:MAG: SLC13 family permease [Gammaproteobacteria bacterium]|nr:SLC13 family permease [Rhodocyclaceae bacterium]MBU3907682.1 SLC13 family permease [Gammaproteobacteria bacterium]MBU3989227.1 SLC13 family permease [Gammaproteobacteria bacterium]MBU4004328.1 SLC13 family permease [Gammaproteobacteria bacterium]MBU4019737.1 SLC13 family permease [Gammaproteobacteria bacterium]
MPEPHMLAVLALTFVAFVLFASEKVSIESTALFIMVALVVGFTLFPHENFRAVQVFSGFGHEALVAISSLMILGRGLLITGALEPVARRMAQHWSKRPRLSMLVMLLGCALASGFLNDTPIVVVMLPIIISIALRTGESASRLLMPMNYSVLVGGMGTTIGTSTNLLVVSIAADLGLRRFEMLDFFHVAAIAAVFGLLYLWLVLPHLLPERGNLMADTKPRVFDAWLYVPEEEEADVERPTLSDIITKAGGHLRVIDVRRGEDLSLMRLPTLVLKPGDRLLVQDTPANLKEFESVLGFSLHGLTDEKDAEEAKDEKDGKEGKAADDQAGQHLAEVVVTESSPLHQQTLREQRFAERFGLIVLGLRRAGQEQLRAADEISEVRLQTGDMLLVQGNAEALDQAKHADLLVLDGSLNLPRSDRAPIALVIMACVVTLALTKLVPIAISALGGVMLMLATRCLDWKEIGRALSSKVVLIVVSSLALGASLTATGGTEFLARGYLTMVEGMSAVVVLSSLMLLVALFTSFVSNNAAAAIGTPIAASIAAQLGVSPEPFVLAVLFGANFSYATPMGYQTNLLVMSAAGYRFSDFLRGGVPLLIIMWIAYSILLPIFFPLQAL